MVENYKYDIDNIKGVIDANKQFYENSKFKKKEIKQKIYNLLNLMKEDVFANLKIVLDFIELEYKQNNLSLNNYNKLTKFIDILK